MTLSAGTRLGPYEILAPIGAGGMGEVYRRRHTQRLRRFEQEALATGLLNHPNLLAVYDVGSEGRQLLEG